MTFTSSAYQLDPERYGAEVLRCKSCDPQRLEISAFLSEIEFQKLGGLFSRFLDLTISVKDLTHRVWDLDFLVYFPQTRSLHLKCLWSLNSIEPVTNLRELSQLEFGSLLNGEISLAPLVSLKKIKSVAVSGKWRDLFYLAKLQSLEKLVLGGLSEGEFQFISELAAIQILEIVDSPIHDLSSLRSERVRSLRLSNLRNLSDLDWIISFTNLRHLKLRSLPKVDRLPPQYFLDRLETLSATHLKRAGIRSTVELQKREEGLFTL